IRNRARAGPVHTAAGRPPPDPLKFVLYSNYCSTCEFLLECEPKYLTRQCTAPARALPTWGGIATSRASTASHTETRLINKISASVAQALEGIQDGATVLVGGFGTAGIPMELIDGLCRSEEHTSELQSRENLVCRLLLEKKKEI